MVERDPYAPSAATLAGDNADIYFRRSCDILEAEQLNPVVAIEVFTRRRALLCGMREAQALLRQVLGEEAEVWSLDEGDWIEPREVVLRIRAPYRQFGLYETVLLGMLSSETGWATAAAECVAAADGGADHQLWRSAHPSGGQRADGICGHRRGMRWMRHSARGCPRRHRGNRDHAPRSDPVPRRYAQGG